MSGSCLSKTVRGLTVTVDHVLPVVTRAGNMPVGVAVKTPP
ncbi:MAG: hypothetical protein ABSC57_03070 [Syntrophales bacterium]